MSNPGDYEAATENTKNLARLLGRREDSNPIWQASLDDAFFYGLFDHNPVQPYIIGPDGKRYFAYYLPHPGEINAVVPCTQIDDMVEWGAGAAILDRTGHDIYVYSPGDIVGFKLYGKSGLNWIGGWAKEPDFEAYARGGPGTSAKPNEHMMPPLVARCLEYYIGRWMRERISPERELGVSLLRLGSHTQPEDSSDLAFNIFLEDCGNDVRETGRMMSYIGSCMPRHLNLRVVLNDRGCFGALPFTPVKDFFLEAGLSPIQE